MNNNSYVTAKIIFLAFIIFNLLLPAIAYFLNLQKEGADTVSAGIESLIPLVASAVVVLVMSFIIPQKFAQAAVEKAKSNNEEWTEERIFQAAFTPFIVRMALLEFINIVGFIVAFMSGKFEYMIPFTVVALYFILSRPPSEKTFKKSLGMEIS